MLALFLAAATMPTMAVGSLTPRLAPAPARFEARGGVSIQAYVSARIIHAERVRLVRGARGGMTMRRASIPLDGVMTPLELVEFP